MNWYYAVGGRSKGPLTEGGLRQLACEGAISPDTLVWHPGLEKWARLEELKPEILKHGGEEPASCPEGAKTGGVPLPERTAAKGAGAGILKRLFGWGRKKPE